VDNVDADLEGLTSEELDSIIDDLLGDQGTQAEPEVSEEELLKPFTEIEARTEEIYQHYLDNEDKTGDQMLSKLYELQGYNKTPSIATRSEMDLLEKAGNHHIIYRGVEQKSQTDAYKFGDHFAGKGIFGNGSYNSTVDFTGQSYTAGAVRTPEDSTLMRIALPKSAKIIDYDVASKQQYSEWKDLFAGDKIAPVQVFGDVGRWATAKGYDAIQIKGGTDNVPIGEDYFIVLNRGKVTVQDENWVAGSGGT
jgi:hypothetical protein